MSSSDLQARILYLSQPGIMGLVHTLMERDTAELSLWLRGRCDHPQWVAQQVACLQKARTKLPSWFEAGCIILPMSLEQSTSELAAALKDDISGGTLLDLTCGLGADAVFFSRRFKAVTTLERDPDLALLAKHNFSLLGAGNATVINTSAEEYLASYKGSGFDVIYADPARREAGGKRRFLLQDCSPDVLSLREKLTVFAAEAWIKVSPLFDLKEGIRLLHPVKEVRVIAVDGEVKEVLFCLTRNESSPVRVSAHFSVKGKTFRYSTTEVVRDSPQVQVEHARFILEPDVALYKSGTEQNYMAEVFPGIPGGFSRPGGYFISAEKPATFPGAVYEVEEVLPYQPEKLRRHLKALSITRANLTRKEFDIPLEKVRQALKIQDGGNTFLIFTRDGAGQRWMLRGKRLEGLSSPAL